MTESHIRTPAVVYAAFSTAKGDPSIDQQLADCAEKAAQEGWIVIGSFQDSGKSAFKGDRGAGLAAAMKAAETAATKDTPCVLLVRDSTRLARGDASGPDGARSLVEVATWAQRNYVTLRSVRDDAYFSNPVLVAVADMMAHGESALKSQRSKSGVERRKAEGKHVGGRILGYKAKDGLLTPVPEEAKVVQRIFSMLAAGETVAGVARILNAERDRTGSPAPLRGGKWLQGSISQMVKRRTYLGEIPVLAEKSARKLNIAEQWTPGAHEAIITPELWEAAHASVASRLVRPGRGGGARPKGNQLLGGGLLRHAECGQSMRPRTHPRKDGVTLRYDCDGRKNGLCKGLIVDAVAVDAAVSQFLADVGIDAEASLKAAREAVESAAAQHTAAIAHARTEAKNASDALDRIRTDYMAGKLSADDWNSFKSELEAKREGSLAALKELEAQEVPEAEALVAGTVDALAVVRAAVEQGNVDAVREAIARLFGRFTIAPAVSDEEAERLTDEALAAEAGTIDLASARKRLRGAVGAAETRAGRSVATVNEAALQEAAEADEAQAPPGVVSADDVLSAGGYVLIPEPRQEALLALAEDGSRPLARRMLPVSTANMTGFTR